MTDKNSLPRNNDSGRVVSVDVLRGIVILLMVLVNNLAGVDSVPSWLKHAAADADGMTVPDVVFPAFLFVMGMAIPFTFERRFASGHRLPEILWHVFSRTVSLLFIGVLMVNSPGYKVMGWTRGLWQFLMLLAVFMVWHSVPLRKTGFRWISGFVRVVGLAGLVALVAVFRNSEGQWFQTQWWGILGLIGWSYIVSSGIYLIVRNNRTALVGALALLFCVYCSFKSGWFKNPWVGGGTIGSQPAITIAGVIVGTLLLPGEQSRKIRWTLIFAAFMALAAWLLRPLYGISKIWATPSWCLWSSVITGVVWTGLYWLIDVRGYHRLLMPVRYTGTNALFAYLLGSLLHYTMSVTGFNWYYSLGSYGFFIVFLRSVIFTAFVGTVSGLFGYLGMRLKL